MSEGLALPPAELAARIGVAAGADPMRFYLEEGRRLRAIIEEMLPVDWSWAGKRALDFGCGSARVLRHFTAEAEGGTFVGCDIDGPSIDWAARHLTPPFRFLQNGLDPPLPLGDERFDLIWAMSVFTHISDSWAGWLAELHRLLVPGGILIASYLGEGIWEALVGDAYVEDEVGMAVLRKWDGPQAWVFHSEWWLREHWGRAFEVEHLLRPSRVPGGEAEVTHSYIALRRREVSIAAAELERIDPREAREVGGLQTAQRLMNRDIEYLVTRQAELGGRTAVRSRMREAGRAMAARLMRR